MIGINLVRNPPPRRHVGWPTWRNRFRIVAQHPPLGVGGAVRVLKDGVEVQCRAVDLLAGKAFVYPPLHHPDALGSRPGYGSILQVVRGDFTLELTDRADEAQRGNHAWLIGELEKAKSELRQRGLG